MWHELATGEKGVHFWGGQVARPRFDNPEPFAHGLPINVNHILVDFENVRKIDLAVIGGKSVHFTLLLGAKDKKLDVAIVEKLWDHAASVQLVRLTSAGRNALDFALAYYLGRAALADPTGKFHIVSKDKGYEPLVEHLRSRSITVQRHDDFTTLKFLAPAKLAPVAAAVASPVPVPVVSSKPKPQPKPKSPAPVLDERTKQLLKHFRTPKATHPKTRVSLISFAMAHLGRISAAEAEAIVDALARAGYISFGDKDKATYQLK